LIVGLARTGVAVARFWYRPSFGDVTDLHSEEALSSSLTELTGLEIDFELGRHVPYTFLMSDLIVVSPGCRWTSSVAMARSQKRRV